MKINSKRHLFLVDGDRMPEQELRAAPREKLAPADRKQEMLDRITALARQLLNAPIACVWLMDADRNFMMSSCGILGSLALLLSYPFCKQMMVTGHKFAVPDGRQHPILATAPAVRDGTVRAFAGWPLVDENEQVIGTICVMDQVPHDWSPAQLDILGELSTLAEELPRVSVA